MIPEFKFRRKVEVHWLSKYGYVFSPRHKYWSYRLKFHKREKGSMKRISEK
jgi:hypothetical protein